MRSFPLFQQLRSLHYTTRDMGFHAGTAAINRIQARYRLAMSFQNMELDGYHSTTARAYSDLFRIFLTYSAFEQFLTLYKIRFFEVDIHFIQHSYGESAHFIRRSDPKSKLLDFLIAELDNATHKNRVQQFKEGASDNPVVVAAALRHLFAHGKMGPHANRSYPAAVGKIAVHLSQLLIQIMDIEFERTLHTFCEQQGLHREDLAING